MAAASLTVYGKDNKILRTYGGNRTCVRSKKQRYESMTKEQFLVQHMFNGTEEDYAHLRLSVRFNKY